MAGGTSNGNSRELDQTQTSTWSVAAAVVNAVISIISTASFCLKVLHKFGEWFADQGKEKALFEALEKVTAGAELLLKFLLWVTETLRKLKMTTIDEKDKSVAVRAKWSDADNEKILVGLMVDQIKKGNRPTITASTNAWLDQIKSEFHKKTGITYERQQFKYKYNKMKRVYREFKKLRDIPTGFSWDPNTKTVTAPDDVWDNYIEINKKVIQFRIKGCPLFDELEIIYGDATATGENAGASTQGAVDTDDENNVVPFRNQTSPYQDFVVDQKTSILARSRTPHDKSGKKRMTTIDENDKSVAVRAKWSDADNEKILVGLMVDQIKKGNRPTITVSTNAWLDQIKSEFHKKTGITYERQQFKYKYNKMKRVYREFKKLRDIPTGFSWDPNTKTVTAPDDVWDNYIEINKKAIQFRTKGCPLFDELEIIYGDATATGENAGASTQGAVDTDDENNVVPFRNQTSPDQDFVVDQKTSILARSRTPHRKSGKKGASSLNHLTKNYDNKVANERNHRG